MSARQSLWKQACGQTEQHLCEVDGLSGLFHRDMVADLQLLREDARREGFELAVASSFRSFDRQLAIWSGKAHGQRPVLDSDSRPLDITTLSDEQLMWAILRWSALPGASRHHWGCDLDIYDRAAVDDAYQLQLVPDEYQGDGPFTAFSDWLSLCIQANQAHGFFLPYARDLGGVAPEPWHISYAPLAQQYVSSITADRLLALWRQVELPLLTQVEANLEEIMSRFICIQAGGN